MSNKKLFSEFAPISKQAWVDQAIKDLKGGDFDKKLVWKTDDRLDIQPFYTLEDISGKDIASNLGLMFPKDENCSGARSWENLTEIVVDNEKEANKAALDFLASRGADGIVFNLKSNAKINFSELLKGIDTTACVVSFKKVPCSLCVIEPYFKYLKEQKVDFSKIKGFINYDPIGLVFVKGEKPDFEKLAKAVKIASEAKNFFAFCVKSSSFVNAGANYTQELGYTMAKFVSYIDNLEKYGVTAKEVFENALTILAMNTDYFFEIAKFRAIRIMLIELSKLYNVDLCAKRIKIGAVSSVWAVSKYDPHTNMLRATTEAMSAVLAGVDFLNIAPYDSTFGYPSSFSRRIALNISNLIKEESYFDKVIDPAAGSYYIENLTYELVQKSLEIFKSMEKNGGIIKSFESGELQKSIEEVRNAKRKDIASRKKTYVGVNRYPNNKEVLENPSCCNGTSCKETQNPPLLPSQHASKPYECLRQRTEMFAKEHGKRPSVHLACYGNPAMRTARAMFTGDFFGVASFEIKPEQFYSNAKQAAEESAKTNSEIVVICSSDDDYLESAVEFAKTFKALAKDKILVLAGYPETIIEELKNAGVDEFIHIKVNTLDALSAFQTKLGIRK